MAAIKIEQVDFGNTPTEPVEVTIKHRLTSLPDIEGNWVVDSPNTMVQIDGYFVPPFFIEGLLYGVSYMVKIVMNCDTDIFVEEEFITPALCPDAEGIEGTTGGGNPEDQFM